VPTPSRALRSKTRHDLQAPGTEEAADQLSPGSGHGSDPEAALDDDQGTTVLAVGLEYFHDGRVGPERYASDLAPTVLGSVTAAHLLLKGLFEEMGAPRVESIEARCSDWQVHFGPEPGQARMIRADMEKSALAPEEPTERQGADEWIRGLVASRDSNHAEAMAAFQAEAEAAVAAGVPQRAAIAYRSAAVAGKSAGRADNANRMLRLAGKSYLEIAERADTIPQGVFMAYREGARCFLEAGNLPLAHTCLSKAIAIGETLGYTE
jgi:hypothetical protein